jgi:aspartyl-tRNA(Asn)/glutamyl-tRNA(Gln) amidotransferase subunit A
MSFANLSITEALKKLSSGEATTKDLVEYYLGKIEELNSEYNALLFVRKKEDLIKEAEVADTERANGSTKKLLGIPFILKDSFMAIGTPTTGGDSYLKDSMSQYNATIVEKLLAEGAILIGKANMDSWGFGSTTENSAYGVSKNPLDKERVAGGSSGGSAAALALDFATFTIGEDTGGSIRGPISYCGNYGLKPTYGRISRYGCIAYASSLDSIGPMTRTPEDLLTIFNILQGPDDKDMTIENFTTNNSQLKKRFVYSNSFIPEGIDEEMKRVYLDTIEKFKKAGYEAIEMSFDSFKYAIPTYYITAMSEASTNLSRYHGSRYGKLNEQLVANPQAFKDLNIKTWEDLFTKSRTDGFGTEAKRRVLLGAYTLSAGYFHAYYKKAQKLRNKIHKEIQEALKDADFILSPVTLSSAVKIGSKTTNPVEMYLEDIFTVTANLAGIPALAFPGGKDINNLPIGMQIMGNKGDDEKLVTIVSELLN